MKKIFVLLICMLVLISILSSCDKIYTDFLQNGEDIKIVAYLNGELYQEAYDWFPLANVKEKAEAWVGYLYSFEEVPDSNTVENNAKVMLYENDAENNFIAYDSVIDQVHIFHKTSTQLPKVYSTDVKKIVCKDFNSGKWISFEGTKLKEFCDFLKGNYSNSINTKNRLNEKKPVFDNKNSKLFFIYVYFKGCPVYLEYGQMTFESSGKVKLFADFNRYMDEYKTRILVPRKISQYINDV